MDSASSCASSVSGDSGCDLHVCSLSCEKPWIEQKQCPSNTEAAIMVEHQDALNISSISEKDNIPDAEIAGGAVLPVQDPKGKLSGSNATSADDTFICNEMNMCQDLSQSVSFDAKMQKCLDKCATFPFSKDLHSNPSSSKGREGSAGIATQDQCSSTFESSAYSRSMSLPTSLKLVSAMKGSRAQNGALPNVELHVKWSPEVYDPPATSMSHTVRSHQRPKAKKKEYYKNKNKGKSSRGNGSDRKRANRRNTNNIPDPSGTRLQASGERLIFEGYAKSKVEVLEYAASSQESKCGSSFLREAVANVHLSIGEAS